VSWDSDTDEEEGAWKKLPPKRTFEDVLRELGVEENKV
jgi:3-mercaptopyruvate sulfurtransferase SseA